MAIPTANRPKGRSIRNLRMVWSFAARYPGRIACAGLALLIAAAAATSIPYGLKLVIDKGFGPAGGEPHHIANWFEGLLGVVVVMAVATAFRDDLPKATHDLLSSPFLAAA